MSLLHDCSVLGIIHGHPLGSGGHSSPPPPPTTPVSYCDMAGQDSVLTLYWWGKCCSELWLVMHTLGYNFYIFFLQVTTVWYLFVCLVFCEPLLILPQTPCPSIWPLLIHARISGVLGHRPEKSCLEPPDLCLWTEPVARTCARNFLHLSSELESLFLHTVDSSSLVSDFLPWCVENIFS